MLLTVMFHNMCTTGPPEEVLASFTPPTATDQSCRAHTQCSDRPSEISDLGTQQLATKGGALVAQEEMDTGVVKLQVYKSYWVAVGHCLAILVLLSLLLMQGG